MSSAAKWPLRCQLRMFSSKQNHRRRKRGGDRGGGGGGAAPPNNLRGGQHTLWPPDNPPTFSFKFYVKQEKITNVPS